MLFLGLHDRARSLMAERIMQREGRGRFRAYSAGVDPADAAHPMALQWLRNLKYDVAGLRPKHWRELTEAEPPLAFDFVFTLSDEAHGEMVAGWPGQSITSHWEIPDPVLTDDDDAEQGAAFADAYRMLWNRITVFVNLPLASIDHLSIQRHLRAISEQAETA
ncbi:putative protein tyrosine phosphatase [Magnetofaba australis IT-1]|uniref:Phosphotyrosine protein phosphatase I domain-containing protein n=1 Tax=Magnetofaba australis IT-1 TaxID=1434232 RepID=A0A1Y2K6Y6_9PROT|nr:putative protein tyrosine phosphatase [Magnetofaba australis IT-1]